MTTTAAVADIFNSTFSAVQIDTAAGTVSASPSDQGRHPSGRPLRRNRLGPGSSGHRIDTVTTVSAMKISIARVYDDIPAGHGHRALVDRLWPRGVSKASAPIDEWCKDIAPSPDLRKWYSHDSAKFDEFGNRYREELADAKVSIELIRLRGLADSAGLVLVTAVRNVDESSAAILQKVIVDL